MASAVSGTHTRHTHHAADSSQGDVGQGAPYGCAWCRLPQPWSRPCTRPCVARCCSCSRHHPDCSLAQGGVGVRAVPATGAAAAAAAAAAAVVVAGQQAGGCTGPSHPRCCLPRPPPEGTCGASPAACADPPGPSAEWARPAAAPDRDEGGGGVSQSSVDLASDRMSSLDDNGMARNHQPAGRLRHHQQDCTFSQPRLSTCRSPGPQEKEGACREGACKKGREHATEHLVCCHSAYVVHLCFSLVSYRTRDRLQIPVIPPCSFFQCWGVFTAPFCCASSHTLFCLCLVAYLLARSVRLDP